MSRAVEGRRLLPWRLVVLRVGGRGGGGCCPRCRSDALLCGWGVRGEPFQVDRGAAEQELDVEGGRAAAADAVECVMVLELGDHALGVDHSPSVGPEPCSFFARVLAASASCCALVRGARPSRGSIVFCGGM